MFSKLKEKLKIPAKSPKENKNKEPEAEDVTKEQKAEEETVKNDKPVKEDALKPLPSADKFPKDPILDIPAMPYVDSLTDEDIKGYHILYARLNTESLNRPQTQQILKDFAGKLKEEFDSGYVYLSGNDFAIFTELKENALEEKRKKLYQYVTYLKESKEKNVDVVVSAYEIARGNIQDALGHAEDLLFNTENPIRKEEKRVRKQFAGLSKQQQELKEKITKSHVQPDPADIKESITKLRREYESSEASQLLAVFIIDKTCNNLFIFTDIDNFFEVFDQEEYNFDFTYLYALNDSSFVPIGIDTFYDEITDMLRPIGEKIKKRQITSLSDIEQIKDIGFFEQVGIDIDFSKDS